MHVAKILRQRETQGRHQSFLYTPQIAIGIVQSVDLVFPVSQAVTDCMPVLAASFNIHCRRIAINPRHMIRYTYLITMNNTATLHYKTYLLAHSAPLTDHQLLLNLPYKVKLTQDLLLQVGTPLP